MTKKEQEFDFWISQIIQENRDYVHLENLASEASKVAEDKYMKRFLKVLANWSAMVWRSHYFPDDEAKKHAKYAKEDKQCVIEMMTRMSNHQLLGMFLSDLLKIEKNVRQLSAKHLSTKNNHLKTINNITFA